MRWLRASYLWHPARCRSTGQDNVQDVRNAQIAGVCWCVCCWQRPNREAHEVLEGSQHCQIVGPADALSSMRMDVEDVEKRFHCESSLASPAVMHGPHPSTETFIQGTRSLIIEAHQDARCLPRTCFASVCDPDHGHE